MSSASTHPPTVRPTTSSLGPGIGPHARVLQAPGHVVHEGGWCWGSWLPWVLGSPKPHLQGFRAFIPFLPWPVRFFPMKGSKLLHPTSKADMTSSAGALTAPEDAQGSKPEAGRSQPRLQGVGRKFRATDLLDGGGGVLAPKARPPTLSHEGSWSVPHTQASLRPLFKPGAPVDSQGSYGGFVGQWDNR